MRHHFSFRFKFGMAKAVDDKFQVDVMALNILFYIFREYQEEGKIPEHICYNV